MRDFRGLGYSLGRKYHRQGLSAFLESSAGLLETNGRTKQIGFDSRAVGGHLCHHVGGITGEKNQHRKTEKVVQW